MLRGIVLNNSDFSLGETVLIVRHRHGWEDGRIKGVIVFVGHRSGGAAYYRVKDDDGFEYDIKATRDLRAIE